MLTESDVYVRTYVLLQLFQHMSDAFTLDFLVMVCMQNLMLTDKTSDSVLYLLSFIRILLTWIL